MFLVCKVMLVLAAYNKVKSDETPQKTGKCFVFDDTIFFDFSFSAAIILTLQRVCMETPWTLCTRARVARKDFGHLRLRTGRVSCRRFTCLDLRVVFGRTSVLRVHLMASVHPFLAVTAACTCCIHRSRTGFLSWQRFFDFSFSTAIILTLQSDLVGTP